MAVCIRAMMMIVKGEQPAVCGLAKCCMSDMNQKRERGGRVSCLGVLLIVCMLALSAVTLTVNILFRKGAAVPSLFGHRYYCYESADMEPVIPAGALVILDAEEAAEPAVNDIVLYRSTTEGYSIGQVSLVLNSTSTEETVDKQPLYYLTTADNTVAVAVSGGDMVGVCRQQSVELGAIVGFLTGTMGLVLCLILPCVVLLLYLAALFISAREDADDDDDDDDTDLAFVKALQEKKKALEQANADDASESEESRSAKEREAAETEAAIRRAEKFAAIRKNIEGHRATNHNTSEVPLYTTSQTPIPTTKHSPAPDPELMDLIAGRSAQKTQSLPKASEAEKESADALIEQLTAAKAEPEIAAESVPAAKPEAEVEAAPAVASVTKQFATPKKAASAAAPQKAAAPKKAPAAKPAAKSSTSSSGANFADLMAMLDAEKKKLDD